MIRAAVCLVLLTFVFVAGCQTKNEADASKKTGAGKDDTPKPAPVVDKTPSTTKGGKDKKAKGETDPSSEKKDGTPFDLPADLVRLEHKGFVIFYKGFKEEQMKAYLDHIYKYWGRGNNSLLFNYQEKLAKQNQGMRIVREDDFTRIMFPVEAGKKNDKDYFGKIALPLCGSLIKIDESVKGKIEYATCNEDCTVIYRATDKFFKR